MFQIIKSDAAEIFLEYSAKAERKRYRKSPVNQMLNSRNVSKTLIRWIYTYLNYHNNKHKGLRNSIDAFARAIV